MNASVFRGTLSLFVLAAGGTLVTACGDGRGVSVTKTRAVAYAEAVNLQSSDVPGMGILVHDFETRAGPPFGSCANRLTAADKVVGAESSWFLRARAVRRLRDGRIVQAEQPPVEGVHSVVYVMRDSALATRNVAAVRGARVPNCVERASVRGASGHFLGREPYKTQITALAVPFPLTGVRGYGLRVRGTFAAAAFHQKKREPFYEDTFGFSVGPAEIVLYTVGVARPFPSAEERRLLFLLYDGAKAHALS